MEKAKVELLAPAGNVACFKAACIAGADAVYLAGKRFGARAFAGNFDENDLWWVRRVTAALGRKMYVTLNTIVFEHEFALLQQTLDFYEALQPDALIVQDIGVAAELRRRKSKIPLHLSTQGAWFGQGGSEELQELGVSRVILPREVSLAEMVELKNLPFALETFVHGAMCYSISGRCFWSASLGSRSGNRGTCAQPCRKDYSPLDNSLSACYFSPRDLRLIEQIPQLIAAGISSLKIEGRMKSSEYVFQVVKAYRRAIDDRTGSDQHRLLDEVFSRTASTGFFFGPMASEKWRTSENTGREGVVTGHTTGRVHDGLVEIRSQEILAPGDGLFWYDKGERHGSRITWVKIDRKKPDLVWVRGLPSGLGENCEIRRSSTGEEGGWENLWNKDWERRPIDLFWSGHDGTSLAVEAVVNEHPLRLETDELLQLAINHGLEEGPLQEKFAVLGDLFKVGRQVTSLLGKRLHISSSSLKKLKRLLVENLCKLEQLPPPRGKPSIAGLILSAQEKVKPDFSKYLSTTVKSQIHLRVWNHSFPFLRDLYPDCWILPWNGDHQRAEKVVFGRVAYWLPPILNSEQFARIYSQLQAVESGEFWCLGWEAFTLAKLLPKLKFCFDWSFNICNLAALDFVRVRGLDAVLSREWKEDRMPENLVGFRSNYAWNPLVTMTRFKPAVELQQVIQNSHNDRFFQLDIGNGVTAKFLEDKPASITRRGNASIQLDIAVSPTENPVQIAKDLNRMLESFKNS